jgi:hypothetical protein
VKAQSLLPRCCLELCILTWEKNRRAKRVKYCVESLLYGPIPIHEGRVLMTSLSLEHMKIQNPKSKMLFRSSSIQNFVFYLDGSKCLGFWSILDYGFSE